MGAAGVVEERMDSMSRLGDAAKAIATAMRSDVEWNSEAVRRAAKAIERHATSLPALFADPATAVPPSASRPEIWSRKGEFDGLFRDLAERARLLAGSLDSGGRHEVAAAFAVVGKTCSACHRDFRLTKTD